MESGREFFAFAQCARWRGIYPHLLRAASVDPLPVAGFNNAADDVGARRAAPLTHPSPSRGRSWLHQRSAVAPLTPIAVHLLLAAPSTHLHFGQITKAMLRLMLRFVLGGHWSSLHMKAVGQTRRIYPLPVVFDTNLALAPVTRALPADMLWTTLPVLDTGPIVVAIARHRLTSAVVFAPELNAHAYAPLRSRYSAICATWRTVDARSACSARSHASARAACRWRSCSLRAA